MKRIFQITLAGASALIFCARAEAYFLDDIGVTAVRAATNLDGSGIRVAQPEGSLTTDLLTWEIDPANVGRSATFFTYASSLGTASSYPNSLGTNSWHAEDVGGNLYGLTGSGVATNLAHVDNFEANYFFNYYVISNLALLPDMIVNQSFTFGPLSVSDQQSADSDYDNYTAAHGVLFVSAANNFGTTYPNSTNVCAPGTSYNCISVGAYSDGNYDNSLGPTADNGRCKPDITAPNNVTSFSTPLVSGAAAMLWQGALRGDGGDTNSAADLRTIKALLLNGAVKPANWTNSNSSPLDARYGSGVLNIFNSYKQLSGGKNNFIVANAVAVNAAHPPEGSGGTISVLSAWNFSTNTSSGTNDSIHHYYFNVSNQMASVKFSATATLVWMRHKNKSAINNLNLYLYNCANSNLVACSTSLVDNVEHIYTPQLAPGRYDLQVWKAGGMGIVSTNEAYALAWEFVPPPTLAISSGTNSALNWPTYPAGFLIETTTNLLSPNWSTNGFSVPTITNNLNFIPLNATNPAQFFRLRKPDL